MKYFITLVFCLAITALFAQNKGIGLLKNDSRSLTFLKENQRIKIKTIDGQRIAGKFTVVNDSTISIKNNIIPLDSIATIRKESTFSSILRRVSISIGAVLLASGIGLVAGGGIGAIAAIGILPVGLPLFIVPLTVNKHPTTKWKYQIVNK
jgi:hypothetical protein